MSDAARRGFVGLGSNQGDREAHLRAALVALQDGGAEVERLSSLYETSPLGDFEGEQPDYLNAVAAVRTSLTPRRLLGLCKRIEVARGRDLDAPRHGPRPLDLDILMLGDLTAAEPDLTIPHPGLLERRFVLEPLLEIEPGARTPRGEVLAEAVGRLPEQGCRRVAPGLSDGRDARR